MNIGIYNRWLHTMGGGERYMGTIAEALSVDPANSVDLLTDSKVDLADLSKHLNLDLSRCNLRLLPETSQRENMSAPMVASADYDLFINASHLDLFPSFAKRSVVAVYFPAQLPPSPVPPAGISAMLENNLPLTVRANLYAGFYPLEKGVGKVLFRWTAERAAVILPAAPAAQGLIAQFIASSPRPADTPDCVVHFTLNGQPVGEEWIVPRDGFVVHNLFLPPDKLRQERNLLGIECPPFKPSESDQRSLGMAVAQFNLLAADANGQPIKEGIVARLFRRRYAGSNALWYLQSVLDLPAVAHSMDAIWSISRYTAEWVKRYWGMDSELLYPPVDVDSFSPGDKVNQIISVGRFFAGSHNKKHDVMVKAFRGMCDGGLEGWEFHLVGNVGREPEDTAYLETVKKLAEGYPIFIHNNLPFADLQKQYACSKIFWHATGYGEDTAQHPERFEHFGITTVEAMAAGCVPVVIAEAGQTEIVADGENGMLWQNPAEMQAATLRLIYDDALRQNLSVNAVRRSHEFDKAHTLAHLHELVAKLKVEG
jgi:glycosyltransferase involved in cell wall biosynthesis